MNQMLHDKLTKSGPKRILSLDGGGIRGVITLGYLKRVEEILAEQHPHITNFRLCNYFDLIGGTSTGAIIATALALGYSVEQIIDLYEKFGREVFGCKSMLWIKNRYSHKALVDAMTPILMEYNLGSDKLQTGLCIVTKNATTNSIWPFINHPNAKYYHRNKTLRLLDLVRASTAAPTYFKPQDLLVKEEGGKKTYHSFIDGGVSVANNPSLTLLMIATIKKFPFKWNMDEKQLMLLSVGTGEVEGSSIFKGKRNPSKLFWAMNAYQFYAEDASWQNRGIMQWLSDSPTKEELDREINDLDGDYLASKPLVHYLRYNLVLNTKNIERLTRKKLNAKEVSELSELDAVQYMEDLKSLGSFHAEEKVLESHFRKEFIVQ